MDRKIQEETLKKLNNTKNSFFKKLDEKSGVFYLIIAVICLLIFVITIVYFYTRVKFDSETETYIVRDKSRIYELKLENITPYSNDFNTDTEDIILKKENDLSSLIYTEYSSSEQTDNIKINASIPKINISSDFNIKELEKIKEKIVDINDRILTVRTVFEGDNQLNFNYYASYYQNTLSFGYSYYENFNKITTIEKDSFVYNVEKNKMMTFNEYLNSRDMTESKISEAIREIIRREKLKHKYNKKTKFYYIESNGIINLILDDNSKISIVVR